MARSRSPPAPAARSASAAASRPRPAPAAAPASQYSAPAAAHPATPAPAAPAAPASSGGWFSRPSAPAPAPVAHAPAAPPALQSSGGGGGLMSGLMGSMVTGAAMGTGSAIAHRAVDSFMGPRETHVVHEHAPAAPSPAAAPQMPSVDGPCSERVKQFGDCMSRTGGDMGSCQIYFDAMQQCRAAFA
ncbi:hypothetical protein QJQ45_003053 [Haematococcus lacustris]|nr:hypothetical protein QJQ45_003053 [Haematococcus lacustris]